MQVLTLMLAGCVQVEPSGSPFAPVDVPAEGTATAAAPADDPIAFPEEERLKMTSDGDGMKVVSGLASAAIADDTDEGQADDDEGTDLTALVPDEDAEGAEDDAAKDDDAAEAPKTKAGGSMAAASMPPSQQFVGSARPSSSPPVTAPTQVGGWPVRLVKTIDTAQPPRAILGLPDGREVVVTPGSMVPEEGLVVVAIGPDTVNLSQVTPKGDHASITSFTLSAMY